MSDLKRDVQDNQGVKKQPTEENAPPASGRGRSRTAGTNRDYDESGYADNQGHGHPREEHRSQTRRRGAPRTPEGEHGMPGGHAGQGKRRPNTSGDGAT